MSFEMELFMMLPPRERQVFDDKKVLWAQRLQDVPCKSAYLWETFGIITAHISHPPDRGEPIPDPLQHANRCMMSWIFRKLQEDVLPRLNRSLIAPYFAIYEDALRTNEHWPNWPSVFLWEENFLTYEKIKTGVSFIIPPRERSSGICSIELQKMRKHNTLLSMSRRSFVKRLRQIQPRTSIPFDPPFVWLPSGVIAKWLLELERGDTHNTQQQLKRDLKSRMIVEGRRKNLASLHRAGCRILVTSAKCYEFRASSFF